MAKESMGRERSQRRMSRNHSKSGWRRKGISVMVADYSENDLRI